MCHTTMHMLSVNCKYALIKLASIVAASFINTRTNNLFFATRMYDTSFLQLDKIYPTVNKNRLKSHEVGRKFKNAAGRPEIIVTPIT